MLAKRIIPTILTRGRQMVKGVKYDSWRSVGLAAQAVRVHSMRGVDELVLLDISATAEGRGPDLKLVEELAEVCYMPLAVGGGIRKLQDVQDLLNAGADKVVVGTAGFDDGKLLQQISGKYGNQVLVLSIDVKQGRIATHSGGWIRDTHPTIGVRNQAIGAEGNGVGEILLNSIDREGTLEGYDLDLIRQVSSAVNIPVIASCGAGTYEHMRQAIEAGADAVAAASIFLFTDATPKGAAQYLLDHGIEARL